MRSTLIILSLIFNFAIVGCAKAVSPPRTDYILSKPHGWVEVTIKDEEIPAAPQEKGKEQTEPSPPYCSLTVYHNNERFLSESLYPIGDMPPYSLDTGFRFPLPAGEGQLELHYFGCDVAQEKSENLIQNAPVFIDEGHVTPINFDGTSISVGVNYENKTATLESIDTRLQKIETILEK
jgi:hypothetical protein